MHILCSEGAGDAEGAGSGDAGEAEGILFQESLLSLK